MNTKLQHEQNFSQSASREVVLCLADHLHSKMVASMKIILLAFSFLAALAPTKARGEQLLRKRSQSDSSENHRRTKIDFNAPSFSWFFETPKEETPSDGATENGSGNDRLTYQAGQQKDDKDGNGDASLYWEYLMNDITSVPSSTPTASPTASPTEKPSSHPSEAPTASPSAPPTMSPSSRPSDAPTMSPSSRPSDAPTAAPSSSPTATPTIAPSSSPTLSPVTPATPAPVTPATPAPATPATPSPVTPATPAPVTPATPAPVTPATPAPVTPATPAPVTPATPAPVTPATPAPVTPATPAPVTPPTPAPVTPATPAPVTPPTPAPVTPPTPAPVPPPTPAPVTPPTPAPVTPPTPAPVPSPTPAPVPPPTPAPVPPPTPAPVPPPTPAPVPPPTPAPVTPPTPAPVPPPTPAPVPPPTPAPVPPPTPAPVPPPTPAPVPPPTPAPVPPPTPAPVTPPTPAPVPTGFEGILTKQDTVGVCGASIGDFGCANLDGQGNSGNPNDAANCFNIADIAGGSAPFFVRTIRFWLGDSIRLPSDLKLRIWSGSLANGPAPLEPIYSEEIFGYEEDFNSFDLSQPFEITANEFCVGIGSETVTDGLRVRTEPGDGTDSYIVAPVCGGAGSGFTSLDNLTGTGFQLDFCIEAEVFRL